MSGTSKKTQGTRILERECKGSKLDLLLGSKNPRDLRLKQQSRDSTILGGCTEIIIMPKAYSLILFFHMIVKKEHFVQPGIMQCIVF